MWVREVIAFLSLISSVAMWIVSPSFGGFGLFVWLHQVLVVTQGIFVLS